MEAGAIIVKLWRMLYKLATATLVALKISALAI